MDVSAGWGGRAETMTQFDESHNEQGAPAEVTPNSVSEGTDPAGRYPEESDRWPGWDTMQTG